MEQAFYKYQATGNDFILLDDRLGEIKLNQTQVKQLCNRHFGIGADGLMLLRKLDGYDFEMRYYNSDGKSSSMCGNGGRSIVTFARDLGMVKDHVHFLAVDGPHKAFIEGNQVKLQMRDIESLQEFEAHSFLDTGSPHHVEFRKEIANIDIQKEGSAIRYGSPYFEEGTNVNFVQKINQESIKVRTYERGIEGETLSCGTGVTACALASFRKGWLDSNQVKIEAEGGDLEIHFTPTKEGFTEVYLIGPAEKIFEGTIEIDQ